jgi:sigma-B regulation protein RsbU (phosphoserine phosphatase)
MDGRAAYPVASDSDLLLPMQQAMRAGDIDLPPANPRISSLQNLMQELGSCHTPFETLHAIRHAMVDVHGSRGWIMLSTRGLGDGEYRIVQFLLGGRDADGRDPWADEQELPIRRGGVIGALIRNPHPRIVDDVDWSDDPKFGRVLVGYTSLLSIPLAGESLPMTWLLLLKRGPKRFTSEELEHAVLRTSIIGSLLESKALATDLVLANRRIDADAAQVGELQRSLLPQPLPKIAGLAIAASYEPCGRAGGDLYDIFPLDDATPAQRWCLLIADASGHGLAAAVVIAMVQAILHAHPPQTAGPGALLAHVNRQLCRKEIGGFVTAFLGIYEPSTRKLEYASAGHPPPFVKRAVTGHVSRLDAVGCCPLGVHHAEISEDATTVLGVGETLLLYTDGITETRCPTGEMFSDEGLQLELDRCHDSPAALIAHLERVIKAFREGHSTMDDQTMVAVTGI